MIKPSVYPRWAERPFGKAFQRILGENSRVFAGFRYGFWVFCLLLGAPVAKSQMLVISEFMASNQSGLRDEDGDDEDWIEIYNPGNSSSILRAGTSPMIATILLSGLFLS